MQRAHSAFPSLLASISILFMAASTNDQSEHVSSNCVEVQEIRDKGPSINSAGLRDATKKSHILSVDDIRIHHDRIDRRRRMLYGDLLRHTLCVTLSKLYLYVWDVIAIFAGLCVLCYGLYLRFFEADGAVAPPNSVYVVSLAALGIVFISIASLVGLQRQRKCVTEGRRNYVLGSVVVLSLVGGAAAFTGGVLSLMVENAASSASGSVSSYSTSAFNLEQALAANILGQATANTNEWQSIQDTLKCCGYTALSSPNALWDATLLSIIRRTNHASTGKYCTSCTETSSSNSSSTSTSVCPKANATWCRPRLLEKIELHHNIAAIIGLTLGFAQLFHTLLSLYTLIYDVRTLRARSPELEIPRQPLAPVAQIALISQNH